MPKNHYKSKIELNKREDFKYSYYENKDLEEYVKHATEKMAVALRKGNIG